MSCHFSLNHVLICHYMLQRHSCLAITALIMSEDDVRKMAMTMYGEARNQSDEGIRAVGHVVKNRYE